MNDQNPRWIVVIIIASLLSALLGGLSGGWLVYSNLKYPGVTSLSSSSEPATAPPSPTPPKIQLSSLDFNTTITEAVKATSPSVVTVLGTIPGQVTFFGRAPDQQVSGSGVIISQDGYVVTNNHVVEDAKEVAVILAGGTHLEAKIIGTDRFADLAVLKVEGDSIPSAAPFGNSENLSPGETVIAIGSPLGKFKNTVTVGVVSATDRRLKVSENYQMEGLIQTDAAINEGNSGGPLINLAGEVIGINTIVVRGGVSTIAEGLGFAIPSNRVRVIAEQIIEKGYFARPYLGISWEWITPGIADAYNLPVEWGAYVSDVGQNSPAAKGGLREGDIIVQFGSRNLDNNNPFINALYDHSPGDEVTLLVKRGEDAVELTITLSEQPGMQ